MKASCDPAIVIRPGQSADAPRLQAIEDAAGALFAEVGLPEVAFMAPRSRRLLVEAAEAERLWVACLSQRPVGFALVERLADGTLHLEELSVDPAYGRRGIGTALVRHVEEALAVRGHTALTLSTFRDVAWNAPWYRRLGYRILNDDDLTPVLQAVRREEAALGLAPGSRVVMQKQFYEDAEN
ncbi:MAG: GNAT family N-acetyltransferase [Bacteroidota bacterium]